MEESAKWHARRDRFSGPRKFDPIPSYSCVGSTGAGKSPRWRKDNADASRPTGSIPGADINILRLATETRGAVTERSGSIF
jgi:hypothetical protein